MDKIEVEPVFDDDVREREFARILRAWFDDIIDAMTPEALGLVRERCLRTERSAANVAIIATIERRLVRLKVSPPRGS